MKRFVIAITIFVVILLCLYIVIGLCIKNTLGFNIVINDVDCSLKNLDYAKSNVFAHYYQNMNFKINDELTNKSKEVTSEDFDFSKVISLNNFSIRTFDFRWPIQLIYSRNYRTEDGGAVEIFVDKIIRDWDNLDNNSRELPVNAKVEYNSDKEEFEIIPDRLGKQLDLETFKIDLINHILSGSGDFNIDTKYLIGPDIIADNDKIIKLNNDVNSIKNYEKQINIAGNNEDIEFVDLVNYISIDNDNLEYTFDYQSYIDNYHNNLVEKYHTTAKDKEFITHTGETVTISGGTWGLELNDEQTKQNLLDYFENKTDDFELVWDKSDGLDQNGFEKYVEIDLSNQHLYMYNCGTLICESDLVSGNVAAGHSTPAGVYELTYKAMNVVLRGADYASPVTFWMPFNGGIGMHDANWRYNFGGNIYTYNGSHGCINLPYSAARDIYNNIDKSYAIICYWQ